MTPLNLNLTKYSTRRNFHGLLSFVPEPEQVYRRKLHRLSSRRILSQQGFESISNLHLLFDNQPIFEEMDDIFSPFDFTAIVGYPHALSEKALEKLPTFQGNNAISAKTHVKDFSLCINKWCNATQHNHQDVKMKLFALSLEEEAFDWFSNLYDNKFPTLNSLIDEFMDKWGDKKEHRHALAALNTIKKTKKETMLWQLSTPSRKQKRRL